ncbi:MAG: hypothetical protein GXO32_05405 [Crenarchaeota archaeon]|nr:hypothetical protein [Thermoproteota archaeon]
MGTALIEYSWMDAELLARPSFAYPLLQVVDKSTLRKVRGFCAGLELKFLNGKVIARHEREVCLRYAELMLDPEHRADPSVASRFKEPIASIARELFAFYRGFTVLSSPLDDAAIFAAILLSRYTYFHGNTVRWMELLLDYFSDIMEKAAWAVPEEVIGATGAQSRQLLDLPMCMKHYVLIRHKLLEETDWRRIRIALMYCKGIGPKVADAYLLFVKRVRDAAPVDRNLLKLLTKLGIEGLRVPDKRFCLKYSCSECPIASSCARKFMSDVLGEYAGLFQTIAYVHRDIFCEPFRCNLCPVRIFCSAYS